MAVVVEEPSCSASESTVRPGDQTDLTCEMHWSGNTRPRMKWYAGHDNDEELDDLDLGQVFDSQTISYHKIFPKICLETVIRPTLRCSPKIILRHVLSEIAQLS